MNNKKQNSGKYFIQTSLTYNEESIFKIYNILTEIEATFRVLKTDLSLRPVFHQTDENTIAHINLGVLAYQIVSLIRYQLKQKGIHHDWSNIVRIMKAQKINTDTMINDKGNKIILQTCTIPNTKIKEIYTALNYKFVPLYRKKSVLPEFRK